MYARIRSASAILMAAVLLLLVGACGYHTPERGGLLSGRLMIALLRNQTAEPFINDILTTKLIERFSRSERYQLLETQSNPELQLSGTVKNYRKSATGYSRSDAITIYRLTIGVEATLRRTADDQALWKGVVELGEDYAVDKDRAVQDEHERLAAERLSTRLADELYARMSADF